MITKIFKYLQPLWSGEDGRISLRACLAIFFSWKLVQNLDFAIQKWDEGRSLGDASSIFFTFAGLIATLLGITAWSNMTAKKIDTDATTPPETTINVAKADNVTGATKTTAETVNAENVETLNSENTTVSNK